MLNLISLRTGGSTSISPGQFLELTPVQKMVTIRYCTKQIDVGNTLESWIQCLSSERELRLMTHKLVSLFLAIALLPQLAYCQVENFSAKTISATQHSDDQSSPYVNFEVELSPADARPGEVVTLTIKTNVIQGWHINSIANDTDEPIGYPTEITFEPTGLTAIDDKFTPSIEPIEFAVNDKEVQKIHLGQFQWTRQYKVNKDVNGYSGTLKISFQACDETKCVPPKKLEFQLGHRQATATGEHIPSGHTAEAPSDQIVVEMEKCQTSRPSVVKSMSSILGDVFLGTGERKDRLVLKGTIPVDGQDVEIYLPRSRAYAIENPEPDNTRFTNRTTYISVDQNGDATLDQHESFACNLPVRILDSMFEVTEIHPEGNSITFRKVDIPLYGIVLGRRCPDFWYETVDGEVVSNTSIRGKLTILDVWAVT